MHGKAPGLTHICVGPRRGIALLARLAAILRRENVDIIQAYLLGSQVYALAATALLRDIRLIVAVRASMGLREIVGWNGKISQTIVFGLPSLVDQYVFNSSAGERGLGRALPADRRRVIFNGIDTSRFRPDPGASALLRGVTGAPAGSRFVGIVANVSAYKGYETFVRGAAEVARERPDVLFVAVGQHRNPLGARIEALVAELALTSRFRFLGARSDPEKLVPGMDLVCSTSSTEGFSNAVAEAMACAVPCVVSAVGDSALIVGETGVVVPPSDPAALAAAVRSFLDEAPEALRRRGLAARHRVEQEFGVHRMVESYESLYVSTLPVRRAGTRSKAAR